MAIWPINRYPYTDFNKINLDWIMRKLKEQISGLVASVNGKTGNVVLDASDVGALPDSYTPSYPVRSVNSQTGDVVLTAADVHAMPDDYIPSVSVTSVNGQTGAVVLDADDVGALPDSYTPSYPVVSVNGKTGAVTLDASDVGALPDNTPLIQAGTYTQDSITWSYLKVHDYVIAMCSVSEEVTGQLSGDGTYYYATCTGVTVPSALITTILNAGLSCGTGSQSGRVMGPKRLIISGSTLVPWVTTNIDQTLNAAYTITVIGTKM